MFSRLMPREAKFFDLFAAHADLIVKGGRQLVALVGDLEKGPDVLAQHVQAIDEIETAADKFAHETIALLHSSSNTPLERDEIHRLILRMDDILDLIQDFAEAMYLFDVRQMAPEARHLAEIVSSGCERVGSVVILLHKKNKAQAMLKLCRKIDQLESEAKRVARTGIAKLFREEADVRQLIKMKGIFELLESVTERCAEVGNVIEGVILVRS